MKLTTASKPLRLTTTAIDTASDFRNLDLKLVKKINNQFQAFMESVQPSSIFLASKFLFPSFSSRMNCDQFFKSPPSFKPVWNRLNLPEHDRAKCCAWNCCKNIISVLYCYIFSFAKSFSVNCCTLLTYRKFLYLYLVMLIKNFKSIFFRFFSTYLPLLLQIGLKGLRIVAYQNFFLFFSFSLKLLC